MKKILLFILTILGFMFLADFSLAESIEKYDINIEIKKDGSMDVEEIIKYDFGKNQKHGIFRFIPNKFTVSGQEKIFGLLERELKFSKLRVYRNGLLENIEKVEKNDENGNYFIKIGSQHKTYSGVNEYKIKYNVDGSLRYFDDKNFDEVYWNATGNDWDFEIKKIKVELSSEDNFLNFRKKDCYVGFVGRGERCNIIENNNKIIFKIEKDQRKKINLRAREGMTIAASFDKNLVQKKEYWALSWKGFWIFLTTFMLFLMSFVYFFIKSYLNKFNPNLPISPVYGPYENYHPVLTGYIIDNKLNNRDITAGILSLAQKGYISIEKTEEQGVIWGKKYDYIFKLKTDIKKVENKIDKFFLKLIFSNYISFKNMEIEKFIEEVKKIKDMYGNKSFSKEIKLSEFGKKASSIRKQETHIKKYLASYVSKKKIIQKRSEKIKIKILFFIFAITAVTSVLTIVKFIKIALVVGAMYVPAVMIIIFAEKRYTKKGWEIKNNLKGFKWFLEMTEKERIKYFNSPEKNPQEFLEFLPYATAFGVEKKWEEQFKNIDIEKPDWYTGSGNMGTSSMVSDISKMSDAVNSSVSSVSSSGSGSSGGGSSGGGSGGGGGGSW